MAPIFSAAVDSNRSAPRPAQSPALSPTRSAITAGVRGAAFRIPAPSFPARLGPTAAGLVVLAPPHLADIAADRGPEPPAPHTRRLTVGSSACGFRRNAYST